MPLALDTPARRRRVRRIMSENGSLGAVRVANEGIGSIAALAACEGEGVEGMPEDVTKFASELVDGVIANRERLDEILSATSEHWRLDQMAKVDRIILRIAVYEIAIDRKVPTKAAINESIELAKTFSGDDAGRFVNGVLGRVAATAS